MALDPQIQMLVDNLPGGLALPVGDALVARQTFHDLTVASGQAQPPANLASTEDITVPGASGDLPARVYRPHGEGTTATILFIHGGGFVVGDIDAYDLQARTLAEKSGATVIATDYRLAPEDPYPAGVDDAISVAHWTLANVDTLGGDPSNVVVAGDSAGGNFAAVVAQELRNESPGFSGQLLLYPAIDLATEYPSLTSRADGPVLTAEAASMFDEFYIPEGVDRAEPKLSPAQNPDLTGLPPTIIATAEYDMLCDAGKHYAKQLEDAGVSVTHFHYDTLPHGFFGFGPFSEAAAAAIDEISTAVGDLVPAA
jgi:acetyl esterase